MQGPETIYFLKRNGKFLYLQDGLVLESPNPVRLQFAPDGWQDVGIINQRNQKYFALDRSYSIPLGFTEDGAQILKYYYYTYGIEEKIEMVMARQKLYFDDTHYGFYYTNLSSNIFEIDFSQFKHDGPKVTVNIMEGGIAKIVKANETLKVEVPVEADDTIKIKWTGIKLRYSLNFTTFNGNAGNYESHCEPPTNNSDISSYVLGFFKSSYEGNPVGIITQDNFAELHNNPDFTTDDKWFIQAIENVDITMNFKFRFKLFKTPTGTGGFARIEMFKSDGSLVTQFLNHNFGSGGYDQVHEISQTVALTLNAGEKLFLLVTMRTTASIAGPQVPTIAMLTMADETSSFNHNVTFHTTFPKARRPYYLFRDVVSKLSDGTAQVESNALQQFESYVAIPGDAIRGLAGAKYKTSLSDFFTSYNTVLSLGMGVVDNKLRLERKPDWIDNSNSIDVGSCEGLTISPATDLLFSSLKIGFPEQQYDDVNGRQESNNTHIYKAPNTRVNKELNLVSVYRADPYGGEFFRINLEGKTTTDNDADNDIWIVKIKETPIEDPDEGTVYELDRSLNPYATGLLEAESIFNLHLTPTQCLMRNGPYIRSCFYKQDDQWLKYQTTEKNSELSVAAPGQPVIDEDADIEIADLGDRLFYPVLLEFNAPDKSDILDLLGLNPLQALASTYLDLPVKGVPIKIGANPEARRTQPYQMYAAPDIDLTPFIEIFD